ncbi:MAG TPA: asparagine synthase (glutamine-hydrolyzing) [Gemmatimonadales bacterium]
MCGIAGIAAPDRSRDVTRVLERLTGALEHRGPDASGFRFERERSVGLGHRRLSIVDLACGAQPMTGEDERVWVSYNGEIYNHREVRRELESLGHSFRTNADTEVLVHGWEEWGPGVLERLNGIFALAVYDGRAGDGELWLARDPIGVKPLYVGVTDGLWWFSSELGAARAAGLLGEAYRREAFDEFLVYRFVPSPGTFYPNAWKLPPSTFCRVPLGGPAAGPPEFRSYTTALGPAQLPRTTGEWEEALRDGLRDAVSRQLMADVPVGSLLSGGVDSTVVTRLMRDALPEPPATFGIGFVEEPGEGELAPARRAAAALEVPFTGVRVREAEYLARWPAQIARMGEPIANSGVLLVGMLCAEVRKTHKVVLTGQGADEPLGGYPRHAGERFYPLARRLAPVLRHLPERVASSDRVRRMARLAAEDDEARRFTEILAVFSPREAVALTSHAIDPDALAEPVRRALPQGDHADSLNRLLAADARLSLADDLLIVADHMSMAESVELRVPFLDLEYFGLISRMPGRFKVSALGERKWLYRRAVAPLLPGELRSELTGLRARTGRKLGFATPIDRWFAEWLRGDAEAWLTGPSARIMDHLSRAGVRALIADVRDHGAPRSRQLLALHVLESWLRGDAA